MLEHALRYASQKRSVFPCQENGKAPACAHGVKDATINPDRIRELWSNPNFNIGIALEESRECAIDLDGPEAEAAWVIRECENGGAPETFGVKTPRGRHLYFKGSLPPTIGTLGAKIDTRGRGSYVIAPPSIVNGITYEPLNDLPLAPLPNWVSALVEPPKRTNMKSAAYGDPVSPEIIEAMLRQISPNCKRDKWLIVCGGLVTAPVPDPQWDGLDLFIRWSRGDLHGCTVPVNFQGEEDCIAQWNRDLEKAP